MRTIDADALKELFSEVIGHIAKKPEMNGNLEHMIRASAMVIQMIDDAPTVNALNCSEFSNNWIPCSERLPDKRGDYLVTLRGNGEPWVEIALWNETFGGRWQMVLYNDVDYSDISNVIAWMPLPEPYQGRGEEHETD